MMGVDPGSLDKLGISRPNLGG